MLLAPEFCIEAILGKQCRVSAALSDGSRCKYQDLVCLDDGRQAVRDDKRGFSFGDRGKVALDFALCGAVEGGSRFIEKENLGITL